MSRNQPIDIDVVLLPRLARYDQLEGRTVVVFDVLRATTTITTALSLGAGEVRAFETLDLARDAASGHDESRLLCGEREAVKPEGFDMGNSPRQFTIQNCGNRVVLLATTNGTKAIASAKSAGKLLIGALVNASAVAKALALLGQPVTLLCAGTDGDVAMEDAIGAGAVIEELAALRYLNLLSDAAVLSRALFAANRQRLAGALRETRGGKNLVAAGLSEDIDFAARLNRLALVGVCETSTLTIRRLDSARL